jgi:hypothetical protein
LDFGVRTFGVLEIDLGETSAVIREPAKFGVLSLVITSANRKPDVIAPGGRTSKQRVLKRWEINRQGDEGKAGGLWRNGAEHKRRTNQCNANSGSCEPAERWTNLSAHLSSTPLRRVFREQNITGSENPPR